MCSQLAQWHQYRISTIQGRSLASSWGADKQQKSQATPLPLTNRHSNQAKTYKNIHKSAGPFSAQPGYTWAPPLAIKTVRAGWRWSDRAGLGLMLTWPTQTTYVQSSSVSQPVHSEGSTSHTISCDMSSRWIHHLKDFYLLLPGRESYQYIQHLQESHPGIDTRNIPKQRGLRRKSASALRCKVKEFARRFYMYEACLGWLWLSTNATPLDKCQTLLSKNWNLAWACPTTNSHTTLA